jgi:hypothetical protein
MNRWEMFTEDERMALFGALLAASKDVHSVQDNLTGEQWDALDALLEEIPVQGK